MGCCPSKSERESPTNPPPAAPPQTTPSSQTAPPPQTTPPLHSSTSPPLQLPPRLSLPLPPPLPLPLTPPSAPDPPPPPPPSPPIPSSPPSPLQPAIPPSLSPRLPSPPLLSLPITPLPAATLPQQDLLANQQTPVASSPSPPLLSLPPAPVWSPTTATLPPSQPSTQPTTVPTPPPTRPATPASVSEPLPNPRLPTPPATPLQPDGPPSENDHRPTNSNFNLEHKQFGQLTQLRSNMAQPVTDIGQILDKLEGPERKCEKKRLLAMNREEAYVILDTLQSWIDENKEHQYRLRAIRLLVEISAKTNAFPQSLLISGVRIPLRDPTSYGGLADVFRGDHNGRTVALKRLRANERGQARDDLHRKFCRECLFWRQLKHPNILEFLGVDGETFKGTNTLAMVSPWMEHGTLIEYLGTKDYNARAQRHRLLLDIVQGLAYLHGLEMAHGDLHASNVFITSDKRACLADFGLTTVSDSILTRQPISNSRDGALGWLAPEFVRTSSLSHVHERENPESEPPTPATPAALSGYRPFDASMPPKSTEGDMFALGRMCITICTGRQPFGSLLDQIILSHIKNGKHPSRPKTERCKGKFPMPDKLWNLANDCWCERPGDRPDIATALTVVEGLVRKP